jgi:hypothetical protein
VVRDGGRWRGRGYDLGFVRVMTVKSSDDTSAYRRFRRWAGLEVTMLLDSA